MIQTQKTGFKEFLIVAPTRPLLCQTLAVPGEKVQKKATCLHPHHSSLLTAIAPADILSLIAFIPLSRRPRSACTMTNSICATSTSGHSNLEDSTITDDTAGWAASLVREKRKYVFLAGDGETGVQKRPRREDCNGKVKLGAVLG